MAADISQQAVRDYLRTVKYEAMKLYRVYDGQGRVQYQYDAPTSAKNGDLCMSTQYTYVSTTSQIQAMKETLTTWNSSWDF